MNKTELLRIEAVVLFGSDHLITEAEVVEILGFEIPVINMILEKTNQQGNINQLIQCFTSFTKIQMKKENFSEVKHCFDLAARMLKNGNAAVKNAIELGFYFQFRNYWFC